MADFDLVVTGNLVTAHRIVNDGFVAVSNGKIAFVGRGTPPAAREQIDARGQWVMPGAIDGQVNSGGQAVVTTFVKVEGAGDYLPPYAGNLDIMTAAATKVGEEIAKESLTATAGGGQA